MAIDRDVFGTGVLHCNVLHLLRYKAQNSFVLLFEISKAIMNHCTRETMCHKTPLRANILANAGF